MDDPEANLSILSRKLGEAEAALVTLSAQKDALQADVDAAKAKCGALYDAKTLVDSNDPQANDVRLRLRTEIRKRIERISVLIGPFKSPDGELVGDRTLMLHVRFVNGSVRVQSVNQARCQRSMSPLLRSRALPIQELTQREVVLRYRPKSENSKR
jgi:hypothetical protein